MYKLVFLAKATLILLVSFLTIATEAAPSLAQSQKKFSVSCQGISISECFKQFPFEVYLDTSISSKKVTANLNNVGFYDGINTVLQLAGVENYLISLNETKDVATVMMMSGTGKLEAQKKGNLPNTQQNQAGKDEHTTKTTTSNQNSLEAAMEKWDHAKEMSPDTEIVTPAGQKITLRQLEANRAKAEAAPAMPLDTEISVPGLPGVTLQQLKEKRDKAEKAGNVPVDIPLPDGTKISSSQLKKWDDEARAKTNAPAPGVGFPITGNKKSTPGTGQ